MSIYLKEIKNKGRGVFSNNAIEVEQLIESCPVILVEDETEKQLLRSTILIDYFFYWDDAKSISAIALGYGCFYNHSIKPNARYAMNYETGMIDFHSLTYIPIHEEITINYNGSPDNSSLEWFLIRNIPYHK